MRLQNFEITNQQIRDSFLKLRKEMPVDLRTPLNFSWSNWGFGMESLESSLKRLSDNDIEYIELHGNHYGADLGYNLSHTKMLLSDYGIQVSGVCGMFSANNDLSANNPVVRQRAVDYLKREIAFTAEIGGKYLLIVPGAVGRPTAYDDMEFDRSVETLLLVADLFTEFDVKAAIEPIRSAETSFIHTFNEAVNYINKLGHPGIRHINGDIYHMQVEESHIAKTLLDHGDYLINLHMADSNRGALGSGFMDLDTIIMALYLIGFNQPGKFVTPEPLGAGGDPYPAMYGRPKKESLDRMVKESVMYFRERERVLIDN